MRSTRLNEFSLTHGFAKMRRDDKSRPPNATTSGKITAHEHTPL
jgi:hypothetical protein